MTIPKQNRPRDKDRTPCKMEQMSWYRKNRVLQAGTKDAHREGLWEYHDEPCTHWILGIDYNSTYIELIR